MRRVMALLCLFTVCVLGQAAGEDLRGKPSNTIYKSLLTLAGTNTGITGTPAQVEDGAGDGSALYLSDAMVQILGGLTISTPLGPTYGGTGLDTHASTGVPSVSSGTWSISPDVTTTGTITAGALATSASTTTGLSLGSSLISQPAASTVVVNGQAAHVVCSITGGSVTSTVNIHKVAHGCDLWQGDIVVITGATTAANKSAYVYTGLGMVRAPNDIEVAGRALSGSDTDIALTAYRKAGALDADGGLWQEALIENTTPSTGTFLSYGVNKTSGSATGLELFFGASNATWLPGIVNAQPQNFGTSESTFHIINAYRWMFRGGSLFYVDALGNAFLGGGLSAPGGVLAASGITATAVTTGAAPSVTPQGTGGSATWSYLYVPMMNDGSHGPASSVGTTAAGNATLSTSNYNRILIPNAPGVFAFDVYRTASGGTPATTGLIYHNLPAALNASTSGIDDTGRAGDSSSAPVTNTTGIVSGAALGVGTTAPAAKAEVVAGTMPSTVEAFKVTGTLANPGTTTETGSEMTFATTASSNNSKPIGFAVTLGGGSTGARASMTLVATNTVANTSGDIAAENGNFGVRATTSGTAAATNWALYGNASGGNQSIGAMGRSTTAKNSATNIGVMGWGLNTGSSPIQVGVAGYLGSSNITYTSAAGLFDNGGTTSPILIARDNGTPVFTVADGGAVTATSSVSADSLAIGGGYGSTGVSISTAGVIQADGAITSGGSVTATAFHLSALNTAPSTPTDTCTAGEIRIAADYIYVCSATDTWVRAGLTTWSP